MSRRPLLLALVLVAIAAAISRELVTRDGVGAIEYATGIALVALLMVGAFRVSRRAIGRA